MKSIRLPRLRTFDSWISYRDYRFLWLGNFFSNSAQWAQLLTIGWLVRDLTAGTATSAVQVMTVGGLMTLPVLVVAPWGGVLGDRIDRRKLVMTIQGFMGVCALLFALLIVSDRLLELSSQTKVGFAYAYVLISGVCRSIAQPMRHALVANTVPPESFGNAYATNVLTITGTRIFSPFFGGVLIATLGFTASFLMEAAFYCATVLLFLPMKTPYQHRVSSGQGRNPLADLRAGIRFVAMEKRVILTLILVGLIPNVVLHQAWFLLPIFTAEVLEKSADVGGILLAITGVGGFVSSLTIASIGFTFKKGLVSLASIVLSSVSVILFAQSQWLLPVLPVLPAALSIGMMAFAQAHFRTTEGTLIQLMTPDNFRGRVTSLASYGQGFVLPFSLLVGLLTDLTTVLTALNFLGFLGLVLSVGSLVALKGVRRLE